METEAVEGADQKLRCAVLDDYQGVAMACADWSVIAPAVDVVAFTERFDTEDALAEALSEFDIVITLRERVPFTASLFARLPRLTLLIATGMRNTAIDFEAARERRVTVCGTASSVAPAVELTWALLLGVARNLVAENTALRTGGPWQSTIGADLSGRRLGLIGLGKIGTKVAQVGLAFGMDVVAWSQNLTQARTDEVGVGLMESKEELLRSSDFVSIHLALGERSRGLIGGRELAAMRPTAFLINTSRSAIVDQNALAAALRDGTIAGAGVDVFDTEPLPASDPIRTLPRLLATPHLGYVSQSNYRTYYTQAIENIQAFLTGTPTRTLS